MMNAKLYPFFFIGQVAFYRFVNNLSALLLCKINGLEIFNMIDFLFQIFIATRNTKILVVLNFCLAI